MAKPWSVAPYPKNPPARQAAAPSAQAEGALLRRLAVQGVKELFFDQALLQYRKGRASAEQAATMANLTLEAFRMELLRRGVFGPGYADEPPAEWLEGLPRVANRLGAREVAETAAQMLETLRDRPQAAATSVHPRP